DQDVAGFEHTLEVKRALRSHSVTQGIVGENDLETRRLAVIPFCLVMRAIGTYDTMPGRNLMPKLCCGRAGSPNAIHIHGEPIGMQRVELVEETADPECGWPIGGKNSNGCQSCLSCFPHCVCKPGHKFRIKTSDGELRLLSCHCVTGASSLNKIIASCRNFGRRHLGNGQRAELAEVDVLRVACWRADRLRLRGLRLRRMRQRYRTRQ